MPLGPILYKRTTTGAVQQWQQEREDDRYRTISGQQGGRLVTSAWTVCEGKNVGRANATTPAQQAAAEVAANYTKKRKEGYHDDPAAIDTARTVAPMLAKDFAKYLKRVFTDPQKPPYAQPKLDGMRCLAMAKGLFSRNGNPIVSAPHVVKALEPFFALYPDAILDGELYNHELREDFNTIISCAKKTKPTAEDLAQSAAFLQYHIYDYPSCLAEFGLRWTKLMRDMARTLATGPVGVDVLRLVPTEPATTPERLTALYEKWLDEGYEGQIVRLDALYQGKRTPDLLKRKEFQDAEFTIVDIQEGVGNRAGMAGYAVLHLKEDRTFRANILGDRAYLTDLLARRDEVIGQLGTVLFFRLTPDGVPRFPRLKTIGRPDALPVTEEEEDSEEEADSAPR